MFRPPPCLNKMNIFLSQKCWPISRYFHDVIYGWNTDKLFQFQLRLSENKQSHFKIYIAGLCYIRDHFSHWRCIFMWMTLRQFCTIVLIFMFAPLPALAADSSHFSATMVSVLALNLSLSLRSAFTSRSRADLSAVICKLPHRNTNWYKDNAVSYLINVLLTLIFQLGNFKKISKQIRHDLLWKNKF